MATAKDVVNQVSGKTPDSDRETALAPKQQVRQMLASHKNQISQILPSHVTAERLMQIAFHAIAQNKKLLECDKNSLIGAVLQCAQLGLEPNTILGEAYLVPFWNSRKRHYEVQFMMGYKGMISLARRSGNIQSISANWVCENDEFEYEYGLNERLRHVPAQGERGATTHFYAYAHLVGGGHQFWVMTLAEVEKARDGSQGYQTAKKYGREDTPWIAHFEAMGQKTAVRRLFKWLPCSIEMAVAEKLDAQAEYNTPQRLDDVLSGDYEVLEEAAAPEDIDTSEPPPVAAAKTEEEQRIDKQLADWGFWINEDGIPVNKHGELYDREHHASNKDGAPIVNNDGTFRKRRGTVHPSNGTETAVTEGEGESNSATKGDPSSPDSSNAPLTQPDNGGEPETVEAGSTEPPEDSPPVSATEGAAKSGAEDDLPF